MKHVTFLSCVALLIAFTGCQTEPVHSEQGLAKRIGEIASVEGLFETDATGQRVHATWGVVPVQPQAGHGTTLPAAGTYVRATGQVARGRLSNGAFTASTADFRGIRPPHDLVLRNAKVERHAPPATQPSSTTQPAGTSK